MKKILFTSSVSYPILLGCVAAILIASLTCTNTTPTSLPKADAGPPITMSAHQQSQQSTFGAEERIKRPITLPEDILKILKQDKRNQESLKEGQSVNDISASWFTASEIYLNDDKLPDLIVMATDPHLFGANVVPFWVFQKTPQGNKLVLSVSALVLEVLKSKTNGYYDIRTSVATAREVLTTIFTFNGETYSKNRKSKYY